MGRVRLLAALLLLLLVGSSSRVLADSGSGEAQPPIGPTSQDFSTDLRPGGPGSIQLTPTDPSAAEGVAHRDLGRDEALQLLQGVFEPELQAPAGIFDELHVENYLAPNVAVIPEGEQPKAAAFAAGEGEGDYHGPTLLDSTVPLRTENAAGRTMPVDLSLKHSEGELQPANPLVEVGVPENLGEGIQLPEQEVAIELVGAPAERSPSTVDESVATYPNVARNTDFAVAPAPTGIETLTQLRSAESPHSETFRLDLPAGASLNQTKDGGAEVDKAGEVLVGISPPTALDAAGTAVPVSLEVSGAQLTLTANPGESTQFPLLVDPLFQTYNWENMHYWEAGICNSSFEFETMSFCNTHEEWSSQQFTHTSPPPIELENHFVRQYYLVPTGTAGLYIWSSGTATAGDRGAWNYTVPRFFTDQERYGELPTSFISHMTLSKVLWQAYSEHYSPYLGLGIWDPVKGEAVSYYTHEGLVEHGLNDLGWQYEFGNPAGDTNAKIGYVTVNASETQPNSNVDAYVGAATVELADNDAPSFQSMSGPSGWFNQAAAPLHFSAKDSGLGVSSITTYGPSGTTKTTSYGCIGVGDAACPRFWKSEEWGAPEVEIDPAPLPTGIDWLQVNAKDPVGHVSQPFEARVKVDHKSPTLTLGGPATEQERIGTKAPEYALRYDATDGDSAAATAEGFLGSAGTGSGQFERPQGVALDHKGNVWVVDRTNDRLEEFDAGGSFLTQFGTTGSGDGQISDPRDAAVAPNGTIWVSEPGNHRIQQFSASGQFLRKVTGSGLSSPWGIATDSAGDVWVADASAKKLLEFSESGVLLHEVGSGNGRELTEPGGVDVDQNGNVWLVDTQESRVLEYDENGNFLSKFGSTGSGQGQFNYPYGIAVAPSGNLLVADGNNNRVQEFQPNGTYLRQFGTTGSGTGQLLEPRGVAVASDGTAYVVDAGNRRVSRWSHADLNRQSGVASVEVKVDGQSAEKYAPGCATETCSINRDWTFEATKYKAGKHTIEVTATDAVGLSTTETQEVEVSADESAPTIALSGTMTEQAQLGPSRPRYGLDVRATDRSQEGGSPIYQATLGSQGTEDGQFTAAIGVAVDSDNNVWVSDVANYRVQEFNAKGEYVRQVGGQGSGNGQFQSPYGVAADAKGDIWVADSGNHRVQEFDPEGHYLRQFGESGTGNGQFNSPFGVAVDPEGHIWVADTGQSRVQEFDPEGQFIRAIGSNGDQPGQFSFPAGVAADPAGNIWVADTFNNRVQEFRPEGAFIREFGGKEEVNGHIGTPLGITSDPAGNLWVTSSAGGDVLGINAEGEFLGQFGIPGSGEGEFSQPFGIASDANGNLWVADNSNHRVQRWGVPNLIPASQGAAYLGQLGSQGTEDGQFTAAIGVAVDSDNNVWVSDVANYRVQEFNAKGEYVRQVGGQGSGNGQFKSPFGVAADAKGDIWVADSGNHRVQEFDPEGHYLRQFGESGTGNGQFNSPFGVAVDPEGHIWVADTGQSRVQEFDPEGQFIRAIGSNGDQPGQFSFPAGVAADPAGNIWVADTFNNRVQEFRPEGAFIREFGGKEEVNGHIGTPLGITSDPAGNLWVTSSAGGDVLGINAEGEFLGQFGIPGSGEGEFSQPFGIASDANGNLWVADNSNHRVQRWDPYEPAAQSGIESTEVKIDGEQVDASEEGCVAANCAVSLDWLLDSPNYSPGHHTIVVKATDGAGNTATKSFGVNIEPDTTKPTLETSGELVNAPMGWVEQDTYGLSASAEDEMGYGVTSLTFKIDGKVVASESEGCPDGGCAASLTKSLDMAGYAGGAHSAAIVATDGAGNTETKQWSINVDPEGHISSAEAEDTLEALDETSESTLVASTEEAISAEERESGNDPRLFEGEGVLETEGTPDVSMISTDPEGGFEIELPEEDSISAEPLEVGEDATSPAIAEEAAAVTGNTSENADTVVRPAYNGLMTFGIIRDKSGSEDFLWKVNLGEEQIMRQVDPQDVEIAYEDGHKVGLISAELAHDAVGTVVPTALSLSEGDVLTLRVEHREAPYVYPVVAGAGWEGGFVTEVVLGPQDEAEIREEEERIAREKQEELEEEWAEGEAAELSEGLGREWSGDGVQPGEHSATLTARAVISSVGPPEMYDWVHRKRRSKASASYCAWASCDLWHTWEVGTWFWNGTEGHVGGDAWRGNTVAKCRSTSHPLIGNELFGVGWSGPNPAPYGYGAHLNLWCNFRISWFNINDFEESYLQIQDHLYGDGYQGQHIKEYFPHGQEIEPPVY